MSSEKAPIFDAAAPANYGATPQLSPMAKREQGILQKTRSLQRQKSLRSVQQGEEDIYTAKKRKKVSPPEHSLLYSMIRPHSHRWYAYTWRYVLRTLVFVTVVSYILETEIRFKMCCSPYFNMCEAFISVVLLLEYMIKVETAPERKSNSHMEAPHNYIKFVCSLESFIDVASFLPFFVMMMLNLNPAQFEVQRTLRLMRLFKLPFTWESFRLVGRVLYFNSRILLSSFLVCFIMLLVCSVGLYYSRPLDDTRDNFHSILACLYLAVLMLTGQGEPNGVMPWYTRIVISFTAIFAIAQFAIPASMLTWGFEQEAERNIIKNHEREKKISGKLLKGKHLPESSSSSDESDREGEWEGYLEQVAGSDSSDSDSKKEGDVEKQASQASQASAVQLLHTAQLEHALTEQEVLRAKTVFMRLDRHGDGLCHAQHIRKITDSDKEAQDLLEQLRTFSLGDDVTMSAFILWLSDVKNKYSHSYGDKVFLRLLSQMEAMLGAEKVASTWRRASRTSRPGLHVGFAEPLGGATAEAAATSDLESTIKKLREKVSNLKDELALLKPE